jgi:hypothetical protein
LVSDIPAGDGKVAILFYSVDSLRRTNLDLNAIKLKRILIRTLHACMGRRGEVACVTMSRGTNLEDDSSA